jgi:methylenetetrahydrofolate--tRNA-(uracil-5-)-methyltransferase
LIHHLTETDPQHFQPSNVNFGLFPALQKKMRKRDRGQFRARQALELLKEWQQELKE